ncbi:hypothetical protein [Candidatus Vidania fulgoroideorum]
MKIINRLARIKRHLINHRKDKHSRRGYIKLLSRLGKTMNNRKIRHYIDVAKEYLKDCNKGLLRYDENH